MVLIALLANSGLSSLLNEDQYITSVLDDKPTTTIPRPKQRQVRLTKPEIDELVKARATGTTINALAAQFGIHRTTVMDHLKRRQVSL